MKLKSISTCIAVFTFACVSLQAQILNYAVTFLDQENLSFEGLVSAEDLNSVKQLINKFSSTVVLYYPNGTIIDDNTVNESLSEASDVDSHYPALGFFSGIGTNRYGQTAGRADKLNSAAVLGQGKVTVLGALNGLSGNSAATSINDNSDTVGHSTYSNDYPTIHHAFLHSNEVMTDIGAKICPDTLPYSLATGINNAKQIVGVCCKDNSCDLNSASTFLAFFYDAVSGENNFIKIGSSSFTTNINNKGQAVGVYAATEGSIADLPFLYMNGKSYKLFELIPSDSDLTFTLNLFINDEGQIIAITNQGSVLLTPVNKE